VSVCEYLCLGVSLTRSGSELSFHCSLHCLGGTSPPDGLQAETQHETSNRHGYIVEMAGGLLLTAWAQPSAAINWALALEVALRATGEVLAMVGEHLPKSGPT
jgi:hypothetical protein